MSTKHAIVSILVLGSLTGCVSMGPNYDPAAVAALQPGMSRAEVEKALGRPTTVIKTADGTTQMSWIHSTGSMLGAKARMVTLQFGPDGKYLRELNEGETDIR